MLDKDKQLEFMFGDLCLYLRPCIRSVSKGVNLRTGEGARLEFDSIEDMTAYIDALIAEDYDDEI
jgi:hypothetical protein